MIYLYPMYVRYTRNLFLRVLCVVYLFVFISLYEHIPGLFGSNGVLPARVLLSSGASTFQKFQKPTLLWFAPSLGLDTEYMMNILTLLGVLFSFAGFLSQKFCTSFNFLALWILYSSVYQVGQTFMSSQWDALLVETGLIAALLAPLTAKGSKTSGPVDAVLFFLVRWLLFRLTFSTGALKLASGCPGWWSLNALNVFFENQPLPNALSWYVHHLPTWFLQITTVFTITMETVVPFLYFLPVKSIHSVALILQMFFQSCIFLTGNHSHHNMLVFALALSLVDDQFFNSSRRGGVSKWTSRLVCFVAYGLVLYAVSALFTFKFIAGKPIQVDIAFNLQQFNRAMPHTITVITYFAAFTFIMTLIDAALRSVNKVSTFLSVLFYGGLAAVLLGLSIVPFNSMHPQSNTSTILPQLRPYYAKIANWHIVNPYGEYTPIKDLEGGRPEIIIEGSNSLEGPWLEYEFLFKPGNVNNTLPIVAPYEPWLDVQLAAAASRPYQSNPWLQSLIYRLLCGQAEVLELLDLPRNPFPSRPPKYIRGSKYIYRFTDWSERYSVSWWKREKVGEYFPVTSRDQAALLDALTSMKILGPKGTEKGQVAPLVKYLLDKIRHYTSKVDGSYLPMTLFLGGCILIVTPGSTSKSSGRRRR